MRPAKRSLKYQTRHSRCKMPESEYEYPWSIGNDRIRLRYVNWKGEGRLFLDTVDEKGHVRVFRVSLEEVLG